MSSHFQFDRLTTTRHAHDDIIDAAVVEQSQLMADEWLARHVDQCLWPMTRLVTQGVGEDEALHVMTLPPAS